MVKKTSHAKEATNDAPVPRLAFPATRSRPTSIVDTTTFDTAIEASLSTSPSSSILSAGASPRKHTQTVIDRLTNTQQKDAAAAAKSHRVRTSSTTSRSSTEGTTKTKIPALLKSTASLSPAQPSTSTTLSTDADAPSSSELKKSSPEQPGSQTSTATALLTSMGSGESMSRRSSVDRRVAAVKVAGSPSSSRQKPKPNAPPLVALLSDSTLSKLIKQGAEAKVYISQIVDHDVLSWPQNTSSGSSLTSRQVESVAPVLLKWRFPKTYRHPTLSRDITASRTIMEARALLRCAKAGVAVPSVRCVDEREGILGLEVIAGKSVREWLGGGAEGEDETIIDESEAEQAMDEEQVLSEVDQIKLMKLIGRQLAIMHEADIVHGDLTTSNMMLRRRTLPDSDASSHDVTVDLDRDEIVLIDFGLSSVSGFAEDKAVDLYVLERAFASTHPASESLFQTILDTYAQEVTRRSSDNKRGKGGKLGKWEETRRRLEEVRLRGRKRSMVGFSFRSTILHPPSSLARSCSVDEQGTQRERNVERTKLTLKSASNLLPFQSESDSESALFSSRPALWKSNQDSRLVINVELSLQIEARGVIAAIKGAPALVKTILSLRPQHALRLLPSVSTQRTPRSTSKGGMESEQWQRLASTMDAELDHIGSTRLLSSHTPHESCERTEPLTRQAWFAVPIVPFASTAVRKLPLMGYAERLAVAGLEKAWDLVSRYAPTGPSAQGSLGLRVSRGKRKVD